jgi:hypothetical protein
MKVFLWPRVDALAEYTAGLAFAHANTKEEAITEITGERGHDRYNDQLRDELERKEPEVYDGPMGYTQMGSA